MIDSIFIMVGIVALILIPVGFFGVRRIYKAGLILLGFFSVNLALFLAFPHVSLLLANLFLIGATIVLYAIAKERQLT